MSDFTGETKDGTQGNIEELMRLFPQVVTETKDGNGRLVRSIDFAALRELLGDDTSENDERYDFTWAGKKEAMREAARPTRKTLRPCKEESKNWDTTRNLYIEGDNLEALKILEFDVPKAAALVFKNSEIPVDHQRSLARARTYRLRPARRGPLLLRAGDEGEGEVFALPAKSDPAEHLYAGGRLVYAG